MNNRDNADLKKIKVVTAELMRAIDAEAIEKRGIPGPELMENAGRGTAEKIRRLIIRESGNWKIAVFCGKGNNGGDGFVTARYLQKYGYDVAVYYIGPAERLSPDARLNLDRALRLGLPIKEIRSLDDLPDFLEADFIVDAIFGTGFSGAPLGLTADMIGYINRQGCEIISIDCPSGLNVDTGAHEGEVVYADYTFCLALPKYGLLYSPGREIAGEVDLVPIGIPDDVVDVFNIRENAIRGEVAGSLLPKRKPNGHKGDFGRLFAIAGSTGLTGAASLCALAAARSGLGLMTVGCPKSINPILEAKLTEPMTYPLPDVGNKGVLALRGLGEIKKKIAECDAVIIGPGLGRHHETRELVQRLVAAIEKPMIIDADGLNAFEKNRSPLEGRHGPLILTPHPGEFRRLIDEDIPSNLKARFDLIRKYALKYNAVIVYKESPSLVVDVDGEVYINTTGNDGMATGGTGDVLSGIIGSFLAQGLSPIRAAVAGVYIHGLAGDIAAGQLGKRSVIAGDLIEYLPDAIRQVEASILPDKYEINKKI
jgi:NAD(P)H-hydrate epimerase